MILLPGSTYYDRAVPKKKFYENLSVTPDLKRAFVEQIESIRWRNKVSPQTTNLEAGVAVTEIEVFEIKLRQRSIERKLLQLMDREIPYHLIYLLSFKEEHQVWISYKEEAQGGKAAFKTGTYYQTEWLAEDEIALCIDGLNMDAAYENFIRQVAGESLDTAETGTMKEAVLRDNERQRLEEDIAALERKIRKEKQFNRQVEMNEELKRLRFLLKELEGL